MRNRESFLVVRENCFLIGEDCFLIRKNFIQSALVLYDR